MINSKITNINDEAKHFMVPGLSVDEINQKREIDGGISILNDAGKEMLNEALYEFNRSVHENLEMSKNLRDGKIQAKILTKDGKILNYNDTTFRKLANEDMISDIESYDPKSGNSTIKNVSERLEYLGSIKDKVNGLDYKDTVKLNVKNDVGFNGNQYTGLPPEIITTKLYNQSEIGQIASFHQDVLSKFRLYQLVSTFNNAGSTIQNPPFVTPVQAQTIQSYNNDTLFSRVTTVQPLTQVRLLDALQFLGTFYEMKNGMSGNLTEYSKYLPTNFSSRVFENEFKRNNEFLTNIVYNGFYGVQSGSTLITPSQLGLPATANSGRWNTSQFNQITGLNMWILQAQAQTGFVDPVGGLSYKGNTVINSTTTCKTVFDAVIENSNDALRYNHPMGGEYKNVNGTISKRKVGKLLVGYDVYGWYQQLLNTSNVNGISQLEGNQSAYRGYEIVPSPYNVGYSYVVFGLLDVDPNIGSFKVVMSSLGIGQDKASYPLTIGEAPRPQNGLITKTIFTLGTLVNNLENLSVNNTLTLPSGYTVPSPFESTNKNSPY